MKSLEKILEGVNAKKIVGNTDVSVGDLFADSREVVANGAFFAIKGYSVDGHEYIDAAISNGASVIFCECLPENINEQIVYVQLENIRREMAKATVNFFDEPSKKLKLIGVTGTNGKTTIATQLYNLSRKLGFKAGLLSTIETKVNDRVLKSTHTTPDVIRLNRLLNDMVQEQCQYAFMEVSSHSIDQSRIDFLDFDVAIFSNITRDHLDYHKTFKEYIKTKKKFFDILKPDAFSLTNIDDPNGEFMVQNTKSKINRYSLNQIVDFKGKIYSNSLEGLHMQINDYEAHLKLSGKFNAYNILAIYGAAVLSGMNEEDVIKVMTELEPVTGRLDMIYNSEKGIFAVIDYAHTHDALRNVLETLIDTKNKKSKLITVFGAGGNRDKGKRPLMGEVVSKFSDRVVITSDNPRFENPDDIIEDIYEGVTEENKEKVIKITDRGQAIKTALMIAERGDVVLIAGKGHESELNVKGVKHHFNDIEEVQKLWKLK